MNKRWAVDMQVAASIDQKARVQSPVVCVSPSVGKKRNRRVPEVKL